MSIITTLTNEDLAGQTAKGLMASAGKISLYAEVHFKQTNNSSIHATTSYVLYINGIAEATSENINAAIDAYNAANKAVDKYNLEQLPV